MAEENAKPAAPEGGAGEGDAAAAPKKPSHLGMIVVIVVGVLVMTLTPLLTFFVVKSAAGPSEEPSKAEAAAAPSKHGGGGGHGGGHGSKGGEAAPAATGPVLSMKSVIVNIAQTKGTRILKVEPHLVLSEARLVEELKGPTYMPLLVDRVIHAARRKTIDELEGPQGAESMKRDIISEINAVIKEKLSGAVVDVYFNEFLIQ